MVCNYGKWFVKFDFINLELKWIIDVMCFLYNVFYVVVCLVKEQMVKGDKVGVVQIIDGEMRFFV